MVDNYGREIDYLRISLTEHCNLRCIYCMPQDLKFDDNFINESISFEDYKTIIKNFSKLGINKIRFTGGEPLMYTHLKELIEYTSKECGIDEIAITTNGIDLSEKIEELKNSGLTKVNISLDSFDKDKYKKITGGGDLYKVLDAINKCLELDIKVKINCVFINGMNDSEFEELIKITLEKPIDVRFIELMPIGQGEKIFEKGYINLRDKVKELDNLEKYSSSEKSVADYYKLKGAKGRIGIITPMSCSFCSKCNRIRLTSEGNLKLCLHSEEEIDIKPYLNNDEEFIDFIKSTIKSKPKEHNLNELGKSRTSRKMYQVGG